MMVYMEKIAPPEPLPGSSELSDGRRLERTVNLSGRIVDANLKKLVTSAVHRMASVTSVRIHKAHRHRSG